MAPLILFLILLLSSKYLVFSQEIDQFIYNGFKGANLSLNGAAKIHPNGLLELTNTSHQQIGHAFFPFPMRFNSVSFSTSFVFAMVPDSPGLDGHGIAFVISPSTEFRGAIATQYLGLFNSTTIGLASNHLLAIELDAVRNPEFSDINGNHVGIDVNDLTSILSRPASYLSDKDAENKNLELTSGRPMQLWIDYNATERTLDVTLAPIDKIKPKTPLLSTKINLSTVLLEFMYVGFSASTGSVASNHYILGWSFNQSGQARSLELANLPSLPDEGKSREKLVRNTMIILVIILTILIITISGTIYIMRKRYSELHEDWEQQYGPQRFSYKDLYKATKGFKDKGLLGSGGFGKVYKGILPNSNVEVAVKKVSHDSKQGMKEFVAEIASMGRLRHRNLVNLLGYCRRKGELFLVYDHMPNGSLDKFLFTNEKPNLDWIRRYQIIKGVASALYYLHEEWEQVVLRRDIKSSNVLLDIDLNGRLGDFGLAKFYDHGSTLQTTRVVGTLGYLAPELTTTGKATTRSDIFAFGIFMLEVACGRKPVKPERVPEEVVLVDWVGECWNRGEILRTIDPRLEDSYVVDEIELVLKLGLLCTQGRPINRPTMRQVMQYLDGNANLPEMTLQNVDTGFLAIPVVECEESFLCYSLSDSDSILTIGR
ncbi:L-type lectin-domain containing receptor kinase SIT2-like [Mercurialis annua]|uniref:L-type lectin-domain containing receptor kinase SIT2-like n=1 Tax=Mercurialis annua TaxID=3986 RepID=UPI00215E6239|nr:L-type lectin-domain containing receptor kinase SIT2-like [Mercurialis annua]